MKSFEPVYRELEELFIQKLPEYIQKINIEHNDRIILKPLQNMKLDEECLRLPCFKFGIEETEYSEKDRIIKNSVFNASLEIKLNVNTENKISIFWRYVEIIQKMLNEEESMFIYDITRINGNIIYLRITDNY